MRKSADDRGLRGKCLRTARALDDLDGVFRDRDHAGSFLLEMGILSAERAPHLVATCSGGLAVASEMSRRSGVALDLAPTVDLSPAWPGGPVFGAAALDGTVIVDEALKEACSLSREHYQKLVEEAYESLADLVEQFHLDTGLAQLGGRSVVLIDDGFSSVLRLRAAVAAVRNAGARRVVVGLPVGYRRAVRQLACYVDSIYCGSMRLLQKGPLSAAYASPAGRDHLPDFPGVLALKTPAWQPGRRGQGARHEVAGS